MLIQCTKCGTKADVNNKAAKRTLGVMAIITFMLALIMLAAVPILGAMLLVPAVWFSLLGSSNKLPKCKVCDGHTIPQQIKD